MVQATDSTLGSILGSSAEKSRTIFCQSVKILRFDLWKSTTFACFFIALPFQPATPAPTEALAPREPVIDTCGVDGVEGVADTSGRLCCPLGCGMCGGDGCGSVDIRYVEETLGALPDNAKASDYCCTKAFSMQTPLCGEGDSTSTPCLIPG